MTTPESHSSGHVPPPEGSSYRPTPEDLQGIREAFEAHNQTAAASPEAAGGTPAYPDSDWKMSPGEKTSNLERLKAARKAIRDAGGNTDNPESTTT